MELGEKLLRARLEAGLSQRQLCGEEITRNMLSQIEHGSAKPSMSTLQYLAARLGKSVSYFLEEDAVVSPNQQVMADARMHYDAGDFPAAARVLEQYRGPDEVYDRERQLLEMLVALNLAEQAVEQGREPYAREILEQAAGWEVPYCAEMLERRRLLLLGRIRGEKLSEICGQLPGLEEELLLRSKAALEAEDAERAEKLLEAVESRGPEWCFLRGKVHMERREFAEAARCFHGAEGQYPRETAPYLEKAYREMEDYRRAYEYACRQRS